jgi:hypothetical protein
MLYNCKVQVPNASSMKVVEVCKFKDMSIKSWGVQGWLMMHTFWRSLLRITFSGRLVSLFINTIGFTSIGNGGFGQIKCHPLQVQKR